MKKLKVPFATKALRRFAPIACVAIFGVTAAACGSSTKPAVSNTPSGVTTPAGATTPAAVTAPPQAGSAGF